MSQAFALLDFAFSLLFHWTQLKACLVQDTYLLNYLGAVRCVASVTRQFMYYVYIYIEREREKGGYC